TGVHGIDLLPHRQGDDPRDVEVSADRLAHSSDFVRFIRLEPVQREAIFVRIDGNRSDAELMGRAENANRNLTTIGNQETAERTCGHTALELLRLLSLLLLLFSGGTGTSYGIPKLRKGVKGEAGLCIL